MRDVIIIGGGLSGLAAAYELEGHGLDYTLIEVKPRLGGSVLTEKRDGFVMDGGPFAFARPAVWPTLDDMGMSDALFEVVLLHGDNLVAFKDGAESLVTALAGKLTGTVIRRMAVTSIGVRAEGGYEVCMENGLKMDARGVICAAPARFAERMFRKLSREGSAALTGYHFDAVSRVALGYRDGAPFPQQPKPPPSTLFAELRWTNHPARVPQGGALLQTAVRVTPQQADPTQLVAEMTRRMNWPPPDVYSVNYWAEADPFNVSDDPAALDNLNAVLPPGVALAGNCYRPLTLPERTEHGRSAARAVLQHL